MKWIPTLTCMDSVCTLRTCIASFLATVYMELLLTEYTQLVLAQPNANKEEI